MNENGDMRVITEMEYEKKGGRFRLEELKAPILLPDWGGFSFTGVKASFADGQWRLLALARKAEGEELGEACLVESFSRDLTFWTKPRLAENGCGQGGWIAGNELEGMTAFCPCSEMRPRLRRLFWSGECGQSAVLKSVWTEDGVNWTEESVWSPSPEDRERWARMGCVQADAAGALPAISAAEAEGRMLVLFAGASQVEIWQEQTPGCLDLRPAAGTEGCLKTRPAHLDGDILGPVSLVRHEESGLYLLFYCAASKDGKNIGTGAAPGTGAKTGIGAKTGTGTKKGGSVGLAVSRDLKHWQTFRRDEPTYPDHGVIYEGDYYRAIPFSEYISSEPLPTEEMTGQRIFDVRDYGAVADGATLCTEAFQAAAEAAEKNGGGILLVTGGYYCTGTVRVPSGCTLWISQDSAIYASKNLDSYQDALISCVGSRNIAIKGGGRIIGNGEYFVYLPLKRPLTEPLEETFLPPRLYDPMGYPVNTIRYAYRARIRYAEDRYQEGLAPIQRPMYTVWIRGCQHVEISNIIIEDALDWTLVLDCSSHVQVENVVINGNRHVANTDGIDIMGSSQVKVRHCFVSCADDGICVKSPRKQGHDGINVADGEMLMGATWDIHISDCTVLSVMNCFKIGTETYFDIENITVENCRFLLPDIFPGAVSGISIESADGSHIRHVRIQDIQMDRVCCPVFICLNMRNKFGFDGPEDEAARRFGGAVEDIAISRVRALNMEVPCIITGFAAENPDGRSQPDGKGQLDGSQSGDEGQLGGSQSGGEGQHGGSQLDDEGQFVRRPVENVTIQDFFAAYRDNREILKPQEKVVESLYDYPENNAFGDVPAYGFYIRHADGVVLENVEIVPRTMNTRPCVVREDAE